MTGSWQDHDYKTIRQETQELRDQLVSVSGQVEDWVESLYAEARRLEAVQQRKDFKKPHG